VDFQERKKVKEQLEENRKIIELSFREMESFCGNVINVKNKDGETVLIMSKTAEKNFSKRNIEILRKNYKIVSASIPTIETIGGGSTRCCVGEIY